MKEAEEAWEKEAFDLVILDLNLPDGSGYPFHLAVLRARIQNLLRMTAKEDKMFMRMPGFDLILQNCIIKKMGRQ